MSGDTPLEEASLAQLQNTPIDNVLDILDEGLTHLPSYRELYYRWERQQWSVQALDFREDRQQWASWSEDERRIRLYGLSAFFQGEERVTATLAPYITAMPDDEMRLFLTTQLVDEARHTVFFERFFREVVNIQQPTVKEMLVSVEKLINADTRSILIDALGEVADRIRREPGYPAHLLEGVVLYHLIVEATLALSGQKNMLDFYRKRGLLPSFCAGFTAVVRDESRHVIFGVKFVRDMIQRDQANAHVVSDALQKYLPTALRAMTLTQEQISLMLAKGEDPWRSPRYGLSSLAKKLRVLGLNIPLPTVPPPPGSV